MANPVFNGDAFKKAARSSAATAQPAQPGYGSQFQTYGDQAYGNPAGYGDQGYGAPAGYGQPGLQTPQNAGRLTFDDVMMKTLTVFGVLAVAVVVSFIIPFSAAAGLLVVGAIAGLVLGLVNSFKREPSPALIVAYAVAEGFFAGGLTRVLEVQFPGIGIQAVLATAAVFGVTFALFRSGKVRATPKLQRFFMIAVGAYLLFSLVNLVLMLTGVVTDPWGLRGVEIAGIPLGAIIGVVVIILGAISLIMDFDQIQGAVAVGAPKRMAWTCAFGLLVTVVWLYTEILRFIAILRGND
ncbi:Bax inhibitor-1/YccA family protein [Falsarthrobacter nasiphocae]|uniref:YccA/Bax inhibitor family protein n=1 Tax=Falsarthrobacter nasiphocae TaxID=189863 RepID=A0AAE4C4S5_9MICC|nr:Bax inhibitor-1/YccA family protein [Falsarthrobacter nasiphocae]MDR6891651.1 putative YccA/Bax inhibitor family protein [Falsarthrobacter nasiphocae]